MADALARTEAELRTVVESGDPFLTEVARHLIDAGGKRVRPALAVTAAQVLDADPGTAAHDVIRGGVAVELVHQGSLYHDDVMDGAETRRTVQSVNARWGNLEAILAGDYLLARASEIAADLGYADIRCFQRSFKRHTGVTPGQYRRGMDSDGE